ncbi:uncharacterized protein LOC119593786 [Penaeus monodon]|uniref:uncharacterized protein LOC119593786 n=1 Tax=Penaeus monodon TaxID=6687 RepID=UPI0018A7D0D7|nr:uncharacterized protein LOC119593786 [Penaeus monodon]
MEKDKLIASGKADRYNTDHLDSGLFPESPECQRNVQVMKPGIFLKSSNVTTESDRSQELVEHNSFDLSHKQLLVKKCTKAVNVEIVSDGNPEKLAPKVQDKLGSHLGIKSAITHANKNPLNHFNTKYLHIENIYHQDHSHSVLNPQSTNIAILPGNEHSGNANKCTSSLSSVSSAQEVASDILVLKGKDSSSDHIEKGWWLWIFADGWADIWTWLENLLDEFFPPAHGIQEERPGSTKERCSHDPQSKS